MDKIFKVRYETEIITSNIAIKPKGFSSITFRNIGDTDATILNNIPIKAHASGDTYYDEFMLINRPNEVINVDINIKFETLVTTQQLLVIKTFYE